MADTPIDNLAGRIVADPSLVGKIEVSAVRFHGELWVVEGDRRLWAAKEASGRLARTLQVRTRVADLHLGYVRGRLGRGNSRRCDAVRMFWEKFSSTNGV